MATRRPHADAGPPAAPLSAAVCQLKASLRQHNETTAGTIKTGYTNPEKATAAGIEMQRAILKDDLKGKTLEQQKELVEAVRCKFTNAGQPVEES